MSDTCASCDHTFTVGETYAGVCPACTRAWCQSCGAPDFCHCDGS